MNSDRGVKFSAVTEYGEVIPVRVNEEFYNRMCDEIEKTTRRPMGNSERSVRIASLDAKHLINDAFLYYQFGATTKADSKLKIESARIAHAPIEILDSDTLGTRLFAAGKLVCGLDREVATRYLYLLGKRLTPVSIDSDAEQDSISTQIHNFLDNKLSISVDKMFDLLRASADEIDRLNNALSESKEEWMNAQASMIGLGRAIKKGLEPTKIKG